MLSLRSTAKGNAGMKLKGFLAGLAGGAVAAAAVVLLLVFVFDIGAVNKTVVQATPETRTVYSTPSTTSGGGGLTPEQIYDTLSGGVVMVLSDFGGSATDQFGQQQSAQALGTGFVVDGEGYILDQRARRRRERPAREQRHRCLQQGWL